MNLQELLNCPNSVEKARSLAIEGLFTDGGHHKQWFLERILEALDVSLEGLKEIDGPWDEGIAP